MKHKFIKFTASAIAALQCVNMAISTNVKYTNRKIKYKYFQWEHGKIYYRVSGKGKPILLIHDLNVFSSGEDWAQTERKLSEEYTVYTIDLLGCGKSNKPAYLYTTYLYVQLITSFVKKIIREPANVIASGLSAVPVMMADAFTPGIYASIQLINPPEIRTLNSKTETKSRIRVRLLQLPVIGRTFYYMNTSRKNTEYYLTEECFYNPFNIKRNMIQTLYEMSHEGKGKGRFLLASLEGGYLNTNITSALEKTETNITIIQGETENGSKTAAEYQKINKNITVKKIPKTKKLPQLEKPDELSEILASSCERN